MNMKKGNQSFAVLFGTSFYLGLLFSVVALSLLFYEAINGVWFVESLMGLLGMGLLFIYFSGKPMVDERIQFLKFKGLAIGFFFTCIASSIANYLITYPDGHQTGAVSSYWFAIVCLLIAFISFFILKGRE